GKNVIATNNNNALKACKSASPINKSSKVKDHGDHKDCGKYYKHRHPLNKKGKQVWGAHCWFI
ncbi:MAG: hypothetical protein ACRCUS_09220, partial [Anaerovoracaceae bacterium]